MILHTTFQEGMKTLPDKSVNLIIADPPYFRIKGEFDFVQTFEEWEEMHRELAIESKRVLADNGSIFLYGHAKNIAYQQVIFDKYFKLENSLIWEKLDSMQYQYYSPELARTFNTHNERILFYSNGTEPEEWDETGWEKVKREKIEPRSPFAKYLKFEFKRAGVTNKEIAALFPSRTGGLTGCVSNWLNGKNVITEEQYLKVRDYLNGEYLRQEYEYLRQEYEELRQEYEELRRPFNNYLKLTDVLKFSQESHISRKYDHDTIKPEALTRALITTTTRKGDFVCVPFSGSGTECAVSAREGRKFIGFDTNIKYVDMGNTRVSKELKEPKLFQHY